MKREQTRCHEKGGRAVNRSAVASNCSLSSGIDETGRGGREGGKKGGKTAVEERKVPSWLLVASALRVQTPAESYFTIYLHVIIAMRCRY